MPKNHRNYQKTRHIALSGLLFALAMALSFIEGTLVIPGLLPGMKLGLANIVVMYALFFMGPRQALVLDVLKALFVFLVSGFTAGFLSLCGGLLSLAVMWVLYYLLPVRPTWFILSAAPRHISIRCRKISKYSYMLQMSVSICRFSEMTFFSVLIFRVWSVTA